MTREEAIDELLRHGHELVHDYGASSDVLVVYEQALTTLAPGVRYEPPTVEEVGSYGRHVLHWRSVNRCWYIRSCEEAQALWQEGDGWLPIETLPKPEGGA